MAPAATDTPAAQSTLAAELRVLGEVAGLLDPWERGTLVLRGPDAIDFLIGQITNELAGLVPGEGRYAAFLTHKGKMLGDVRGVLVAGEDDTPELLLDTERAALQNLFDMIRRFKVGYRVELNKRTLERGLLSLIGPRSDEVAAAGPGIGPDAQEHGSAPVEIDGIEALAIRTDVGLDLLCDARDTASLG